MYLATPESIHSIHHSDLIVDVVEYFGYENWNIPRERNNKVDRPKMSNNLPSNNKREKYFAEKYCNIHKELRVMIEECFYLT